MNNDHIFDTIVFYIKNFPQDKVFIGIDGGQGSGKSMFIDECKNYLEKNTEYNILNIETDDFLVERNKRKNLTESFFNNTNDLGFLFDFFKMKNLISKIAKSSAGSTIKINGLYNSFSGERNRKNLYRIKNKNVVIVGGPYLLHPALKNRFDLLILLKADKQNRLKNTLFRNIKKKYRTAEEQKELFKKFEKFYNPFYFKKEKNFDVIINNNKFSNKKILKAGFRSIRHSDDNQA